MEANCRTGFAQDSRNKVVNSIMDTLQRHTPLSGQDGRTELWKIANRFEEKIFYAASDQHDYLRKISLKMRSLESRTNGDALPTSSTAKNQSSVRPLDSVVIGDSVQHMGQAGGMVPADIFWSKMQTLKDKYLEDMKDLYNVLTTRSRQQMPQEQLQKLTNYKTVLERMMPYLVAPQGSLPKQFKQDEVEAFEKQIVIIMETFKRRKQAPQN